MKNKLKLRKLENTALQVSEIGLGYWQLGGEVNINDVSTNYGNVTKIMQQKLLNMVTKQLLKFLENMVFFVVYARQQLEKILEMVVHYMV